MPACLEQFLSTLMNFSGPLFLNLILRAMSTQPVSGDSDHFATASLSNYLGFYASVVLDSALLPNLGQRPTVSETAMKGISESPRQLQRSDAYFFAAALCVCQLIKAQSELQHLYFSRRATIRIDGELIASVYEKILRHKDVSGVTATDTKGKGKSDSEDTPQQSSNGDVGRIMSLISADAHRLSITFSQGPVSNLVCLYIALS
jgi:hypothetical protein